MFVNRIYQTLTIFLVFVGICGYIFSFENALIDDAFITFQYARVLGDTQGWGIFPGEVTNTATSPLNVILTALMGLLFPEMVTAGLGLAVVEAFVLIGLLLLISQASFQRYGWGVIGALLVLTNPLVISSLGLEVLLYLTLLLACIYAGMLKKWRILAFLLALLTLTRPDGVLMLVVMGVYLSTHKPTFRTWVSFVGGYVLTLLPWYGFSWFCLGSLLPDTFFLKFNQNWEGISYFSGIVLYLYKYPFATIISFGLAPISWVYIFKNWQKSHSVSRMLFSFGLLYFLGYSFLRVPPYHWYYAPVAVCFNLVGLAWLFERFKGRVDRRNDRRIVAAGALAFLGAAVLIRIAGQPSEAPIHTNWATKTQYQTIGLWLNEQIPPAERIALQGEIGTLAYYSERRLEDMFSCRYELIERIDRFETMGGWAKLFSKVNFYWFDPGAPCVAAYTLKYTFAQDNLAAAPESWMTWPVGTRWIGEGQIVLQVAE